MKFVKLSGDNLVFQIGRREKSLLLDVLKLYPLVPASHGRLSKSSTSPAIESDQHLLEEALAEHRSENKRQLETMLNEPNRF